MRRVFGELIGRTMEAYVDDIVVKSKKTGDLVPDLTEVFEKLRQHRVKLNPKKCDFVVSRMRRNAASKLIPRRSRPSWTWDRSGT
jgi:hypothetical protein